MGNLKTSSDIYKHKNASLLYTVKVCEMNFKFNNLLQMEHSKSCSSCQIVNLAFKEWNKELKRNLNSDG